MAETYNVNRWCYYVGTQQDFPDICLIGPAIFRKADKNASDNGASHNEDNRPFEHNSWYRLSCITASGKRRSVYRRLRSSSFEGYPADCIVLDPYTVKQLNLSEYSSKDHQPQTHYRHITLNLSKRKFADQAKGGEKALTDFLNELMNENNEDTPTGKRLYRITGFPIYGNCEIELKPVGKWNIRSFFGKTVGHPDYALRVASYLGFLSLFLGLVSILISVIK